METSDVRTSLLGLVPLFAYRPIETGVSYPLCPIGARETHCLCHFYMVVSTWCHCTVISSSSRHDKTEKRPWIWNSESASSHPIHAQVTHIDMSNQPQKPQDHRPRGCKISLARSARVLHAHEDPNRPLPRPHHWFINCPKSKIDLKWAFRNWIFEWMDGWMARFVW